MDDRHRMTACEKILKKLQKEQTSLSFSSEGKGIIV